VLSHRSIIANQHNFLALTRRLPSQIPDGHASVRILFSSPLFHTGGVQAITSAMLTGATIVLHVGRFDPGTVLQTIERERISAWTGVPTVVQRVIEHPDALSRDLSSLRSLGMGGAPLPDVLIKRASQAFPSVRRGVSTNYGMTEAGGIIASASGDDVKARPGTSGRVLPAVELRIDTQETSKGEVLVRSAALMSGYWGEVEQPIDAYGWLRTGDVGRLDEDGFLYIVDRLKDIVIRGGENIATAHVEAVLLEHPAVAAVAVMGLPHDDLGEEVAAVVAARDDTLSSEELADFARSRLAHFEVPSRWWLREGSFPTTITDKIDKRRLKAEWLSRQPIESGANGQSGQR
jgi:long-chain acyl-CoA synthetase